MSKFVTKPVLKAFRQKLDDKYIIEGEHSPESSVGSADVSDNLTPYSSNSGVLDTTPFVFQSTGGESDVGSLAQLRVLKGEVYHRNQLSYVKSNLTSSYFTYTKVNDYTFTFSVNNTSEDFKDLYPTENDLIKANTKPGDIILVLWNKLLPGCTMITHDGTTHRTLNAGENYGYIYTAGENIATLGVAFSMRYQPGAVVDETTVSIQFVNLTTMYGAGKEPTTIEEYTRSFPDYIDHIVCDLVSPQMSKIVNTGYNAFDNELEGGDILLSTGQNSANAQNFRTKNYIKVIPSRQYTAEYNYTALAGIIYVFEYDNSYNYIKYSYASSQNLKVTLTNNTHYVRIQWYKSDSNWKNNVPTNANVCFHLTWDESKTGFEEHEKHEYPLPNVKLRRAHNVYDEIKPNGEHTTRTHLIKFTDLNWEYHEASSEEFRNCFWGTLPNNVPTAKPNSEYNGIPNLECSAYKRGTRFGVEYGTETGDKLITIRSSTVLMVQDSQYNGNLNDFLAANANTYIIYELATPIVSLVTPFTKNIPVDDWGTTEFVGNGIPQGCEFFYSVDYKAFVDSLGGREDIDYDASEVVSHAELTEALGQIPQPDISEHTKPVILASDIASDGTLTDAQFDLIMSRGALIVGDIFGLHNPELYAPNMVNDTTLYDGLIVGGNDSGRGLGWGKIYRITVATKKISVVTNTPIFKIDTNSNVTEIMGLSSGLRLTSNYLYFNNKMFPSYPSSPSIDQQLIYGTDNNLKWDSVGGFKVIEAPSSTTLTADEVATISKGAVFIGSSSNKFLTFEKIVFFPLGSESFGENGGLAICVNNFTPEIRCYRINSSNVISLQDVTTKRIGLQSIARFNGKNIPDYPSSTGTFVLKSVDGALTWVEE